MIQRKHDCRLRSLEVFEDEDGSFFMRDQCNMPFGKEHTSRVEYCPVCGMKSKKSHLNHLKMYPREGISEIREMFEMMNYNYGTMKDCFQAYSEVHNKYISKLKEYLE